MPRRFGDSRLSSYDFDNSRKSEIVLNFQPQNRIKDDESMPTDIFGPPVDTPQKSLCFCIKDREEADLEALKGTTCTCNGLEQSPEYAEKSDK